jgi:hypothetical protein
MSMRSPARPGGRLRQLQIKGLPITLTCHDLVARISRYQLPLRLQEKREGSLEPSRPVPRRSRISSPKIALTMRPPTCGVTMMDFRKPRSYQSRPNIEAPLRCCVSLQQRAGRHSWS